MYLVNKNIVLLETGSFNPPTNMHLRMFGKTILISYFVEIVNVIHFILLFRNC